MGIAVVNALVFSKVVSVPFLFLYQYVQDTPTAAIMTEITDEQLEELKEAFVLYDKVGDDKIDSADVIKLLQALTLNPLTADVKKVLEDSQLDKTRVDFPPSSPSTSSSRSDPPSPTTPILWRCSSASIGKATRWCSAVSSDRS